MTVEQVTGYDRSSLLGNADKLRSPASCVFFRTRKSMAYRISVALAHQLCIFAHTRSGLRVYSPRS
jgi:hypothetical protein